MYENKIAIIIRNDLLGWQKLNVTSFLASSVAVAFEDVRGRAFATKSGEEFLPFINQPILIYGAEDSAAIRRAFCRAKEKELSIGIYPQAFFATKSAEENYVVVESFNDDSDELAGIVIFGETKKVYKSIDGLKLYND